MIYFFTISPSLSPKKMSIRINKFFDGFDIPPDISDKELLWLIKEFRDKYGGEGCKAKYLDKFSELCVEKKITVFVYTCGSIGTCHGSCSPSFPHYYYLNEKISDENLIP